MISNLFTIIAIATTPYLTLNILTSHKNMINGMLFSLFLLFQGQILPTTIIFAILLIIFFWSKSHERELNNTYDINANQHYRYIAIVLRRSSYPMVLIFIISMTAFFAFGNIYLSSDIFQLNFLILTLSYIISPFLVGILCDKINPFNVAIACAFLSEVALFLAIKSPSNSIIISINSVLLGSCISPITILIPAITSSFYGSINFKKIYPRIFPFFIISYYIFAKMYNDMSSEYETVSSILIMLLVFFVSAGCFIFIGFRSRFVLLPKN